VQLDLLQAQKGAMIEGRLVAKKGDEIVHERPKSSGKHFGDDLGNGMDQANRPLVNNLLGPFLLGNEHNVCGV
jgi:hypothetical protein